MKIQPLAPGNLPAACLVCAIPLMLNITLKATMAPNEEPKWGVWMMTVWLMGTARVLTVWLRPSPLSTAPPMRLSLFGLGLLVFWVGLALGSLQSVNPGEAMNRLAFWSLAFLTLIATTSWRRQSAAFEDSIKHSIALGSLLLSVFFWKDFFLDFDTPEYNRFVQFSRIGHFNFTADALMVLIPLNTWILIAKGPGWLRGLTLPTLASLLFMLGMSGSLGGMGGLGAGALFTALLWLRPQVLKQLSARHALTALGLIVALGLAAPPLVERMPEDLRVQMFSRAGWQEAVKHPAAQENAAQPPLAFLWHTLAPLIGARTPMWASTAGMIAQRPLMGFGTGSFLFIYPDFSNRYPDFRDFETLGVKIKTNPHNVLLQIAAENGLPLMLLFTALFLGTLVKTARLSLRSIDAFWPIATWGLLSAGLDAMVNHVFFNPASLFLMALLLGLIHGRLQPTIRLTLPWPKAAASLAAEIMVWLLILALIFQPARYLLSEHRVYEALAIESSRPKASPLHALTLWESATSLSPTNIQALFGLANAQLAQGDSKKARETLHRLLHVAPFHTASLNILATLEAQEGRLEEASEFLRKAIALEPDAVILRQNLKVIERGLATQKELH